MKKTIFVISILTIILGMSVLALNKGDFVQKIGTHATLDHGYTWYNVCNPTQNDYSLTASTFKVNFNTVLNEISQYKFKRLVDVSYKEDVYHSNISCQTNSVNYPNGTTKEVVCDDNSYYTTETKYKKEWQNFDPAGKTFAAGTCHDILVYGDYKFDLAGVSIDNIVEYAGYSFDEYDWWNSTYFNDSFNNTDYIDTSSSSAEVDTSNGEVKIHEVQYSGSESGLTHLWHMGDNNDSVGSLDLQAYGTLAYNDTKMKYGNASLNRTYGGAFSTSSTPFNTAAGTVEFWDYPTWSSQPTTGDLLCSVGGSAVGMFQFDYRSNNEIWWEVYCSPYQTVKLSATLTNNEWHHFALTWNDSDSSARLKAYIDGEFKNSTAGSSGCYPNQVLDRWGTLPGSLMDELAVWNYEKKSFGNYNSSEVIVSSVLNSSVSVLKATLTAQDTTPSGTSIEYYLSNNNGSNWHKVNKSEEFEFPSASYGLLWKANLSTTATTQTPTIEEVSISIYESSDISENDARTAIVNGIQDVFPSAILYTDQQMYTRHSNATQDTGSFDKVATSGNQRWGFNYITSGESAENMDNLGTRVYFWENQSLTTSEVRQQVANLINETKL